MSSGEQPLEEVTSSNKISSSVKMQWRVIRPDGKTLIIPYDELEFDMKNGTFLNNSSYEIPAGSEFYWDPLIEPKK